MRIARIIIAIILSFGLGWFIGYFGPTLLTIELKKEVGLGDVFNFIVTLAFVFLLQNYLQKRFGDDRAEKDHLLDLIKDAQTIGKEVRLAFIDAYDRKQITPDDKSKILSLLRSFSNSLWILNKTIEACGYQQEDVAISTVKGLCLDYKRALSGGKFPLGPYKPETFAAAEKVYGQLSKTLVELRTRINRK